MWMVNKKSVGCAVLSASVLVSKNYGHDLAFVDALQPSCWGNPDEKGSKIVFDKKKMILEKDRWYQIESIEGEFSVRTEYEDSDKANKFHITEKQILIGWFIQLQGQPQSHRGKKYYKIFINPKRIEDPEQAELKRWLNLKKFQKMTLTIPKDDDPFASSKYVISQDAVTREPIHLGKGTHGTVFQCEEKGHPERKFACKKIQIKDAFTENGRKSREKIDKEIEILMRLNKIPKPSPDSEETEQHFEEIEQLKGQKSRGCFKKIKDWLRECTKSEDHAKTPPCQLGAVARTNTPLHQHSEEIGQHSEKTGHPHIVKYYDHFWIHKNDRSPIVIIVTELCEKSLQDVYSNPENRPSEEETAFYIEQVLRGLQYLEQCNIVHGDIRPDNLMLGFDGKLKLIDFGESQDLEKETNPSLHCGTVAFMSPEMCRCEAYFCGTDMWSVGVTLYLLLTKKLFRGSLDHKEITGDDLKTLLSDMLNWDQEDRISAAEALEDPWIITMAAKFSSANKSKSCNVAVVSEKEE